MKMVSQGLEQARGAMLAFWLSFHGEKFQDLNEKSKQKPLLHSRRAKNVMLLEIETSTLNSFLHNQSSDNICGSGTLGVERINRYVNSFRFGIGFKKLPSSYRRIHRIWYGKNILQFGLLLKNKHKWQDKIQNKNWNEIESFYESHLIPSFADKDCLQVELNKNVKDELTNMATEWCLRDKLTFSKSPGWEPQNDMKLLVWLSNREENWKFTTDCKEELCQRFENFYDFEFLTLKVGQYGLHLDDD